jgi:GMP synthase (glutamine-hydrolysing)
MRRDLWQAPHRASANMAVERASDAKRHDNRPILIILHQQTSTPGRIGTMLRARGYCLDIRRPRYGDPLPATMADHAGAVIFGGPMSANDPDGYVRAEIDWLAVPLKEQAPFLGICLGAQMLVRQLGGVVSAHHAGEVEIGYYPIKATEAGRNLLKDWPGAVYQWHREGFDLPAGTELLATGKSFFNQAIRAGNGAYGIQFHPEVTHAVMNRWLVEGAAMLTLPGARRDHLRQYARHDDALKVWLDNFLTLWLASDRRNRG